MLTHDSKTTPKVVPSTFGFKIKNRIYRQHFALVPCTQTAVNVSVKVGLPSQEQQFSQQLAFKNC